MASPNPASPELEETAKGVESTPPVGTKKVSLAELLKRIDEFDEDAVAPVMATGPPSVAPPSILSQPGGPVGRLVPKSIKDFFAPIKSTPAAKAKESKLVELRDPIQIDSESDSSEDVTTLFATPAPSKKTETKAAPEEVGEPLILQEDPLVQVPASVNSKLRDYQREGVKFLWGLFAKERGGILGDDMGLGKTIQTIAFLTAVLSPAFGTRRVLIVAPASVLSQWLDEMKKWGLTKALLFHGPDRDAQLVRIRNGTANILLTSYDTLTRDSQVLGCQTWNVVVFDEIHRLKSHKSKGHEAAQKLNIKCKIGLSGTLLQNDLIELWALLDLISSSTWINHKEMRVKFEMPIRLGQKQNASRSELARRRVAMKKLATELKKFVLRRDKTILGDTLPGKTDQIVYTSLTPLQSEAYQNFIALPEVKELLHYSSPCLCGSLKARGGCCERTPEGLEIGGMLLWAIDRLTKLCNSVSLLLPKPDDPEKQQEACRELCKKLFGDKYALVLQLTKQQDASLLSGKLLALRALLPLWKEEGSKVLIFSKSTRMLDFIEGIVRKDMSSLCYSRLDGSTPVMKRNDVVKEFSTNRQKWIFLISTNAGGLGLNLTVANRVVVFDPQWNPSHDLQAQDRAHRIGQKKDVHVLRFISGGTVEEKIYQRQVYKQQLHNTSVMSKHEKRWFNGVQGIKGETGDLFGAANILAFDPTAVLTDEVIKRTDEVYKRLRFSAIKSGKLKKDGPPGTSANPEMVGEEGEGEDEGREDAPIVDDMKELLEGTFADVDEKMLKEVEDEGRFRLPSGGNYSNVSAALASAGVKFTHRNTDLLGESAIERIIGEEAEKHHRASEAIAAREARDARVRYDMEQRNLAALAAYRSPHQMQYASQQLPHSHPPQHVAPQQYYANMARASSAALPHLSSFLSNLGVDPYAALAQLYGVPPVPTRPTPAVTPVAPLAPAAAAPALVRSPARAVVGKRRTHEEMSRPDPEIID